MCRWPHTSMMSNQSKGWKMEEVYRLHNRTEPWTGSCGLPACIVCQKYSPFGHRPFTKKEKREDCWWICVRMFYWGSIYWLVKFATFATSSFQPFSVWGPIWGLIQNWNFQLHPGDKMKYLCNSILHHHWMFKQNALSIWHVDENFQPEHVIPQITQDQNLGLLRWQKTDSHQFKCASFIYSEACPAGVWFCLCSWPICLNVRVSCAVRMCPTETGCCMCLWHCPITVLLTYSTTIASLEQWDRKM